MRRCAACGCSYEPKAEGQIVCSFRCARVLHLRQPREETAAERKHEAAIAADNRELPKAERKAAIAKGLAEQRARVWALMRGRAS